MKSTILAFTTITAFVILPGCADNKALVKAMGTGTSQGVFQEIGENAPQVPGYADLHIYSSLKTHKPGIYSGKDIHGTQDYMLLVNIDGQATTLKGRLSMERNESRSVRDPEEGEGIRYLFTKILRVKTGTHRVFVALPTDDIVAGRDVIISEGENSSLTMEPIYGSVPGKHGPGTYGLTSFKEGIKSIRLLLNEKTI